MNAKAKLSAVKRTFYDPFKDFKRSLAYFGTFLGVFGFALLNTVSAYDLGTSGYAAILAYFAPSLIAAGFIYWPLLYMGFSAIDGLKWRFFVIILQALGLAGFVMAPADPLIQGLASGITLSPFWCIYHVAMVQNTSDGNRGFEVSVSQFIFLLAGVASGLSTAHFLEGHQSFWALVISLGSLLTGTGCLLGSSKIIRQHSPRHFIEECKKIVFDNPYMARRIISQSLFDMPSFTIAAMMSLMGISPTILATILVSRLGLMFFISPVIGNLAHKNRKHGFGIGLALIGLGWIALAIAPDQSAAYFVCLILYAVGSNFANASLATGLYEMKSYASMMWSEFFLAVGRSFGLIFLIPLLYYDVKVYLVTLALMSGVIFVFNRQWQRKWSDAKAM